MPGAKLFTQRLVLRGVKTTLTTVTVVSVDKRGGKKLTYALRTHWLEYCLRAEASCHKEFCDLERNILVLEIVVGGQS